MIGNCNIEGGVDGSKCYWYNSYYDQGGNIGEDIVNHNPLFFDESLPEGKDGMLGTLDDGLRLQGTNSPCFNSGSGSLFTIDTLNDTTFDTTLVKDMLGQTRSRLEENPHKYYFDIENPDMGAYWVTLSDNPKFTVDFLDHMKHKFGFDKVEYYSTQPDPDSIYINLAIDDENVTKGENITFVNVVVHDPTGMYVQSSNTTVFSCTMGPSNRVDLSKNVTPITLIGHNPDTGATHYSARLEVLNSNDQLVRYLNVELYQLVTIDKLRFFRIIDTLSSVQPADYIDPPSELMKEESNKGFNQGVVKVNEVIKGNGNIHFDIAYGNGILDIFYDGVNHERDAIINYIALQEPGFVNVIMAKKARRCWRLDQPANAGDSIIILEGTTILGKGMHFIGSSHYTSYYEQAIVTDIKSDTIYLRSPLKQNHASGEPLWKEIGGSSADRIITAAPQIFLIIVHELLHGFSLLDVGEEDNIMCWTVNDVKKKILRFREQTVVRSGTGIPWNGMMENQWNEIKRE